MVSRKELLALLATLPPECEGCGAPLVCNTCEYCGRLAIAPPIPDEPPDIRKTNASDDPCGMCGLVHSKDPYAPPICRCLYCGQIGPVAMSTFDSQLGAGVVCRNCCGSAAPRSFAELEAESLARNAQQPKMPWESK